MPHLSKAGWFTGHTKNKRADKALIIAINTYLPEWKIENLVPEQKYVPDGFEDFENFTSKIVNFEDENNVIEATKYADFVYISNPYQTSGEGSFNNEDRYKLTKEVVDTNNFKVLAALPASEELDPKIFSHPNSLIKEVMINKIDIIASLSAHTLYSQKLQNEIKALKRSQVASAI